MAFSCVTFLAPEISEIKCKVQCTDGYQAVPENVNNIIATQVRSMKLIRGGGLKKQNF